MKYVLLAFHEQMHYSSRTTKRSISQFVGLQRASLKNNAYFAVKHLNVSLSNRDLIRNEV